MGWFKNFRVRFDLHCSKDQHERWKEEARKKGLRPAQFIRMVLDAYCAGNPKYARVKKLPPEPPKMCDECAAAQYPSCEACKKAFGIGGP